MIGEGLADRAAPPALGPTFGAAMADADQIGFDFFGVGADLIDRLAVGQRARHRFKSALAQARDAFVEDRLIALFFLLEVVLHHHAFDHHHAGVKRDHRKQMHFSLDRYRQVSAVAQGPASFFRSVVCQQYAFVHAVSSLN